MKARVGAAMVVVLAVLGLVGCQRQASVVSLRSFDHPGAIALDGAHVWIADNSDDSVTEISETTGAVIRIIRLGGPTPYGPFAVSSNGSRVWVAYDNGFTLTEINAVTGEIVKTIPSSRKPGHTLDLAEIGSRLWLPNFIPSSVTEFNADTGTIVRILGARKYNPYYVAADISHVWVLGPPLAELSAKSGGVVREIGGGNSPIFDLPRAIADDGSRVWVSNYLSNSVVEIDARTGRVVRIIGGHRQHDGTLFSTPVGISSDRIHVWVTNAGNNSVTELNASTGALIQLLSGSRYDFDLPSGVSSDGMHVWIANNSGNTVTELDARTGALVRIDR